MPLVDGGNDAQGDDFVAELAEVVVALVKFLVFLGSSLDGSYMDAVLVDGSLHGHHDVVVLAVVLHQLTQPFHNLVI